LKDLNNLLALLGLRKQRSIRAAQSDIVAYGAMNGILGDIDYVYNTLSISLSLSRFNRSINRLGPAPPAEFHPPTRWIDSAEAQQERRERLQRLEEQKQAIQAEIEQIQLLEGIAVEPTPERLTREQRFGRYQLNQQLDLLENLPLGDEVERPTPEQRFTRYLRSPERQKQLAKMTYDEWVKSTTEAAQIELVQRYVANAIHRDESGAIDRITFRFDGLTNQAIKMVFLKYREILDEIVRNLPADDWG
jgi:hypothetical protein